MNELIKQEFIHFAKEQAPKEACALLIVFKGKYQLIKCNNLSANNDHFQLSADDWIKAEDLGEIVGLIHSHVDVSCEPSDADKISCESTNIPWHIYSLSHDAWYELLPSGFKLPLIGRKFYHGIIDCYTLCKDWYKENKNIELPDYIRNDDWWNNNENLYLDNFKSAGFKCLKNIDGELDFNNAQIGDAFLMQVMSNVPNHAAIYLGDNLIMHHLYGRLSSRDVFGGYFQKHTTHILRYNYENS